ncbi:class I SAM-dependent methyltransferase [Gammaproteobacteria bacterium]|jgi:trans-aconitate methyltransferase|nr:class I SAM-dependent methyltransferase [Gammaproteobacteria bacterium]
MKDAVAVFNEWAELDKDLGMEKGHADAVTEMLDFALKERHRINNNFTFLDLGCGNGWVVRKVIENPLCINASGIDGAPQMIANAIKRGDGEEYILANIDEHEPTQKYDLIHSMEVLYYLENPVATLKKIANSWLNEGGRLIVGIDLYHENSDSHSWEDKVGTRMLMFKETEWVNFFRQAGFNDVTSWRANQSKDWAGTLVLTGKK